MLVEARKLAPGRSPGVRPWPSPARDMLRRIAGIDDPRDARAGVCHKAFGNSPTLSLVVQLAQSLGPDTV